MPKASRWSALITAWRGHVFLVLGGVALALIVGEIAVRALVPEPPSPRITEPAGSSPFRQTPRGLYVYRPGASFSHVYDVARDPRGYFCASGRVHYRINNLGFRGEDISVEKPSGVRRILCLGDSFTFGEGAREEDTWPERLGRLAGPETQVINAGVQGYDLDHEALYLFLYGRQLDPDVVVVAFFMNDAMPFGETVSHHARLTETSAEPSGIARLSALCRILERRRTVARQTSAYLHDLRQSFSSQRWKEAKSRISRLREMADHDGFDIVAVIFPLLYKLNDGYPLEREHAAVRKAFADAGIEVLDLLDAYRSHRAPELWVHAVDHHPNEFAHAIAAERIARFLEIAPE
ncbi:MAG: SGNH/GDSL hydrolase family protein [Thermoanaerobaculia bacterium]